MILIAAATVLIGASGPVQAAPVTIPEPDPKAMTQKEIREFNAQLPRNHPHFIRCIKSDETGSLAKKTMSCRTNRQWELAYKQGNQEARDAATHAAGKFEMTIDPDPVRTGAIE